QARRSARYLSGTGHVGRRRTQRLRSRVRDDRLHPRPPSRRRPRDLRRRHHDHVRVRSYLVFTGLVDDVGTIDRVAVTAAGREFRIRCCYDDLVEGESIAVNGACLTVLGRGPHYFHAAAVTTTLGRTTMGSWQTGKRVNLERAMRAGDRFGGHLVQGHVDGVAQVATTRAAGDARLVDLVLPA